MKITPFKFDPEYREYVWGGNRIRPDVEKPRKPGSFMRKYHHGRPLERNAPF